MHHVRVEIESSEGAEQLHDIGAIQTRDRDLSRFSSSNEIGQLSAQRVVGRKLAIAIRGDHHYR